MHFFGTSHLHHAQAVHNHLVTGFEATGHHPVAALLLGNGNRTRAESAVFIGHHHRVALAATGDCLLRHQHGIVDLRLRNGHGNKHARQQHIAFIGHFGTQAHLAGGLVYRHVGEQQTPFLRVFAAVIQQNGHFGFAVDGFHFAFGHRLTDFQGLARRLAQIHIQGVGLLNQRQLGDITLPHQCAFGYQCFTNVAGNRRGNIGIAHIDLRGFHRRIGALHLRTRQALLGNGGIKFLLADGIHFHQGAITCHIGIRLSLGGLRRGQGRTRGFQGRHIRRIVNLEQRLPCSHIAAFFKQAFLHNTGGAGAHLRFTDGLQAAGKRCIHCNRGRLGHHHAYRGCRCLLCCLIVVFSAGRQSQAAGQHQSTNTPCG